MKPFFNGFIKGALISIIAIVFFILAYTFIKNYKVNVPNNDPHKGNVFVYLNEGDREPIGAKRCDGTTLLYISQDGTISAIPNSFVCTR